MKILFLCKHHYMRHDVINDQYGRLYHLPNELAKLGHQTTGICLNYKATKKVRKQNGPSPPSHVDWSSYHSGLIVLKLNGYLKYLKNIIKENRPDVILASSDILHAIIASHLSRLTKIPYVIDMYDNYEAFGMGKIPGLIPLFRKSLSLSNGIITVSKQLESHINKIILNCPATQTIESTIQEGSSAPINRNTSCKSLNISAKKTYIGTAGDLSANRGIGVLYKSFISLADKYPDLHLLLAGRVDKRCPPPNHPRVITLGQIPHQQISAFFNALNVAVICTKDTLFGKFAFPQKTYEILATKTPILVTNIGSLAELLQDYPENLYNVSDSADCEAKLDNLLKKAMIPHLTIPTWTQQAKRLEMFLETESYI